MSCQGFDDRQFWGAMPHSVSALPREDESFMGYLFRLAARRHFRSYTEVAGPCGMLAPTNNPSRAVLEWLSEDARVPIESLAVICRGNLNDPTTLYRGVVLPRHSYAAGGRLRRRVCPDCLGQSNYHRAIWDLVFVTVCPIHRRRLVDTCRDCGARLRWIGADPARCGACRDGDLTRIASQSVSEADVFGTVSAYGLLGEDSFARSAAEARSLRPFADLPDGAIVDFMFRSGLEVLDPRRGRFSLERLGGLEEDAHLALTLGAQVATGWPDTFVALLDSIAMESLRTGNPLNDIFGRVERWLNALPQGSGHAIRQTLSECRKAAVRGRKRRPRKET